MLKDGATGVNTVRSPHRNKNARVSAFQFAVADDFNYKLPGLQPS
jgi:hypothetical protein